MLRTKPRAVKLELRRCLGCNAVSHPWSWCDECMDKKVERTMGRPVVVEDKHKAAEAAGEK